MQSHWLSYHLFYHGDRAKAVLEFVRPTVGTLADEGMIDSFFFIRYSLGGPHVRLRLRTASGYEGAVEAAVAQAAAHFIARYPSTQTLSEDTIRRNNRPIVTWNPTETEDCTYPDNTLRAFPFQPEIERYGGQTLVTHSLSFFALSSVEAIHFLAGNGGKPHEKGLACALLLLARQAWGAAHDQQELVSLLGYSVNRWKGALKHAVSRADEVFERQQLALCQTFQAELETPADSKPFTLAEAARGLSWEIRATDPATRLRILKNHMHMTANRLGLSNPEEAYLGRLLSRTAAEVAASNPAFWRNLQDVLTRRAATPPANGGRLQDLLPAALADLAPVCQLNRIVS